MYEQETADLSCHCQRTGDGAIKSHSRVSSAAMQTSSVDYWLTTCDRQTAERVLEGEPHGSFLVRPGSEPQRYVLSVKVHDEVRHCLISQVAGKFGFTRQDCVFASFDTFLTYYRHHSMVGHNASMDVTLSRPLVLSSAIVRTLARLQTPKQCSEATEPEPEVLCSLLKLLQCGMLPAAQSSRIATRLLNSFVISNNISMTDALDVLEEYSLLTPREAAALRGCPLPPDGPQMPFCRQLVGDSTVGSGRDADVDIVSVDTTDSNGTETDACNSSRQVEVRRKFLQHSEAFEV